MNSLSLFILCLPLLSLAGNSHTSGFSRRHHSRHASHVRRTTYTMQDFYQGQDIIDKWDFFTESDPTHGLVDYQSQSDAVSKGLAFVQSDGTTILKVDNTTQLSSGSNRASIRISSPNSYNQGLFIADFFSMPHGCSVWPAYWSVGPNWPDGGEIDILEGVNTQTVNQMALHTSSGCTLASTAANLVTSKLGNLNCATENGDNTGCIFFANDTRSFGHGFNMEAGGVFAHLWNSDGITIWFFSRSEIPSDITNKNPDPTSWGTPVAFWADTNCNISEHFYNQTLQIDTTLCGDWAGAAFTGACGGTCADFVAEPSNYDYARWAINNIAVYQPS